MNINGLNNTVNNNVKNTGAVGNRMTNAYEKAANLGSQLVLRERLQPADEIKISGKAIARQQLDAETKRIAQEIKEEISYQPHKVSELKAQIENGTYAVETSDIAASIMNRFV